MKRLHFSSLRLGTKGMVSILLVLLLASLPLSAFDGFTDIFGPADEVAATGNSPETPFAPSFGITGTVGFSIEGIRALDDTREIETAVGGGLEIDLSWRGSIVDADAKLALQPTIDTPLQWVDIFKGLSITSYFEGGRLEAGLLKKEWGSGDAVHVVDVLNAPDYRNGIVDDPLAMKVAEPMVLTTATWNDTALEVVYKPMLVPMLAARRPRAPLVHVDRCPGGPLLLGNREPGHIGRTFEVHQRSIRSPSGRHVRTGRPGTGVLQRFLHTAGI